MSNTESEQNNQPEEGVDSVRPEWLPDNFKSPEDLVTSYRELQGTFTQRSQELSEIKGTLAELQQYNEQANQPEPADPAEAWAEQTGLDPETIRAVAQVADYVAKQNLTAYQQQAQQQLAPQVETQSHLLAYQADQIVSSRHDDWDDYKGKVSAAVQADPDLIPQSAFSTPGKTADALDRVYKLVKAEEGYNQQQEAGSLADQGRQNKLNAQTMPGAAGRPATQEDDEEWFDRLKAAHQTGYANRMSST